MSKKALITGITGQDGSYLSELLLNKGYEVHGVIRRSSLPNTDRIDTLFDPESKSYIHYGDLASGIDNLLYDIKPDEIYNLAAMSHVRISFDIPEYTADINATGPLRILEGIRKLGLKTTKYYQASSCLPAGTKVLTKQIVKRNRNGIVSNLVYCGVKNIEDLRIGDEVLSMNLKTSKKEYKKIEAVGNRQADDMFIIEFSNGNNLRLSGNHPIYVINKGWVRTDQINIDDEVIQKIYPGLKGIESKGKNNNELYGNSKAKKISQKLSSSIKQCGYVHPWKGKSLKEYDEEQYNNTLKNPALWKKGNKSWNEGLTTFTSNKLRQIGKKISDAQKRLWGNNVYKSRAILAQKQFTNMNDGEKFVNNLLNNHVPNEFSYNGDGKFLIIDGIIPDFVNIAGKKKIIEVFSEYWKIKNYGSVAKYIKERTKFFKKSGYECLFINLDKIDNERKIIEQIKTFTFNPDVKIIKVIKITRAKSEKVYDIQVAVNHNFFAKGILVHNSEIYGLTPPPQNETTIFEPASPYGCAKLFGYHITKVYRRGYNIFASNGILFNHESPRRGVNFVTRKITRIACRIKLGMVKEIQLGNLDAKRDWGHSKDYVRAMWMILQHEVPDDFVISTGEAYTVREFAEKVFSYLGLDFYQYLVSNDQYKRPVEVPYLCGDSRKARTILGWEPIYTFDALVKEMVDEDMKEALLEYNNVKN